MIYLKHEIMPSTHAFPLSILILWLVNFPSERVKSSICCGIAKKKSYLTHSLPVVYSPT